MLVSNKDFEYEPRRKSGGKGGLIAALVILSVIVVLLLALVFYPVSPPSGPGILHFFHA